MRTCRTESADPGRRLLAYLSSQVATRNALGQAGSDCWLNGQFNNVDQMINNQSVDPNMLQASPQRQ